MLIQMDVKRLMPGKGGIYGLRAMLIQNEYKY